jgi:hypothetical protein
LREKKSTAIMSPVTKEASRNTILIGLIGGFGLALLVAVIAAALYFSLSTRNTIASLASTVNQLRGLGEREEVAVNNGPIVFRYFLSTVGGGTMSPDDTAKLNNAAYMLAQQPELVALIAVYGKAGTGELGHIVTARLKQAGISEDRMFARVYDLNSLPRSLSKRSGVTVGILLCDVAQVMEGARSR